MSHGSWPSVEVTSSEVDKGMAGVHMLAARRGEACIIRHAVPPWRRSQVPLPWKSTPAPCTPSCRRGRVGRPLLLLLSGELLPGWSALHGVGATSSAIVVTRRSCRFLLSAQFLTVF